jgi:replicative DNA helicase
VTDVEEMPAELAPPRDTKAEQAVLGAMMISPAVADEISERLTGADFYVGAHKTIFEAILMIAAKGERPDELAVAHHLAEKEELGRIGGAPYLLTCLQSVPTAANGGYYAGIVHDLAVRRRIVDAGLRLQQLGRGPGDLAEVVEQAQQTAYEATTDRQDRAVITSVGDLVGPVMEHIDDIAEGRIKPGIPTGLSDYDRLTGGHKPGQLIIPAGRTAMGKSVITQNWLLHAAKTEVRPVILFSNEMSSDDMMIRILSQMSQVGLTRILTGALDEAAKTALARAEQKLLTLPLYVVDSCRTVPAIRAFCRRFRQQHDDLAMIGVDYLQRVTPVGRGSRDRHEVVGEIADQFKDLAQDMAMPVIAPCQLNRGPETRPGKGANRPKLSDLRESGNLEQTADIVVLLFRPDYYDKDSPMRGTADLDVAKHRNGPQDVVTVKAELQYQTFRDLPLLGDPQPRPWE